jgi:murein DD-endopeptidase MepM/ murein hydrolase activator NlpD
MWLFALVVGCAPSSENQRETSDEPSPLRFALPLAEPERFSARLGVDHDPIVHEGALGRAFCADYLGRAFPWCYDEHDGTDLVLDGAFEAMDAGSSPVIAAADGVVLSVEDGQYDRCHVDGADITCDGHPVIADHVILEHEGGVRTKYWHLKRGSVAVAVGDVVARGDALGLVGSSGYSSFPHLHFEVDDGADATIDPFAGPRSQPTSWWCDQGEDERLPGPCDAL